IALGQQTDRLALAQQSGNTIRSVAIECRDLLLIDRTFGRNLVGQGILEAPFVAPLSEQRRHDAARIADVSLLGEVGDHINRMHQARGAQGEIARVARPDADAVQRSGGRAARQGVDGDHSWSLANALTAATAMALPPLRPRTIRNGTRPSAARASFDSIAPTKPTGRPITAAGGGAPASSISSRRNKAVGALPIATTAP